MTTQRVAETGEDVTSLRVVRILPATPEVVFDAWLNPEAIAPGWCPGEIFESIAEVDASEGGAFTIVMRSPGLDDPTGEYRVSDRPGGCSSLGPRPGPTTNRRSSTSSSHPRARPKRTAR